MNSVRLKPGFLKFHRWLGLFAGIFVLLQGLSGSLIAFRYELDRVIHPAAMVVPTGELPAPLAKLMTAARQAMPGFKVLRVDYPQAADDAFVVRLADKGGNLAIVSLDAAGHVTRAAPLAAWPVEFAYQLHTGFFYGGEPMIGFVGLALIVMALTGLYVWWPPQNRFRQAVRVTLGTPARAARELHRFIGTALSLLLTIMAFTGMTMAWTDWVAPGVAMVLPFSSDAAPKAPQAVCARPAPMDHSVAEARAARPGEKIKSVRLQARGRLVAVYFQSPINFPTRVTDHVWVDACGGNVLAVNDQARARAGNWFFNWLLPIHSGDWLGLPGRILSWSASLIVIFMSVTGYILWMLRTAQRRRALATRMSKMAQP